MKFPRILTISFILVIVLFLIYLPSRLEKGERIIERAAFSMGTIIQIKVSMWDGGDVHVITSAIEKAFEEIRRVEDVFSVFKTDSEISRINRLKIGEALKVRDEVFGLIEKSIEYNRETAGAFDITVKPLVDLWRLAGLEKRMPMENQIKNALAKIGSQGLVLDKSNSTISFKKEGMAIDLGGIAKGYASDMAIKVLKENGIGNALVNSGGDMYCLGRRSKNALWRVGIQHPRKKGDIFLEIKLADKAVDTSGDYEKYFILNGKRYSHIIDPRTGYPIGDNIVSATIIAKDSVTADALATALCILGHDGLSIVNSIRGVDALIIFKEGGRLKTEMSEGLKRRYEVIER